MSVCLVMKAKMSPPTCLRHLVMQQCKHGGGSCSRSDREALCRKQPTAWSPSRYFAVSSDVCWSILVTYGSVLFHPRLLACGNSGFVEPLPVHYLDSSQNILVVLLSGKPPIMRLLTVKR